MLATTARVLLKALLVGVVIAGSVLIVSMLEVRFPALRQSRWRDMRQPTTNVAQEEESMSVLDVSGLDDLVWFLHITDLHISKYFGPDRHKQFREFCSDVVPTIRPAVTIVTGDLTDAKTPDSYGSEQNVWEWETYRRIITETGVTNVTTWLDIRGNHDAFDIPSSEHQNNHYRSYSIRGSNPGVAYRHRHAFKHGAVSFIGIDACPDPGPRRPFNFFGLVNQEGVDQIQRLANLAAKDSNATIFFGHYPTSVIRATPPGLSSVMSSGLAYLCGHFHTLGGLVPSMYAIQRSGSMELELGDWKDNRVFRLAAIDHGMLSFVDRRYESPLWPLILVTMPKSSTVLTPSHEPLDRMLHSSHIRALVFSPHPIMEVEAKLPGGKFQKMDRIDDSPAYIMPWNARPYADDSRHELLIRAVDERGQARLERHHFRVATHFSADTIELSFLARFLLMSNLSQVIAVLLVASLCVSLAPFWVLRDTRSGYRLRRLIKFMPLCDYPWQYLAPTVLEGYRTMANLEWMRRPMIAYVLVTAGGPWFVGEILKDEYGVVFSWGILCRYGLLSHELTVLYAFKHFLFGLLPFQLAVAGYLGTVRWLSKRGRKSSERPWTFLIYPWHCLFAFTIFFNAFCVALFAHSYSAVALYSNLLKLHFGIVIAMYIWIRMVNMPEGRSSVARKHVESEQRNRADASQTTESSATLMGK